MTDNIINMPMPMNILADRIRTAFARTECGKQEWIEGTLELAIALAEARGRFPANQQLSVWLAENDLDVITKDDRMALINMAGHLTTSRQVLQETTRTSWQWIWREEIEPRVRHVTKTTPVPTLIAETTAEKPPEPEKSAIAPVETLASEPESVVETEPVKPMKPVAVELPRVHFEGYMKNWRLAKKPNADLVYAHILDKAGRTALADFVLTRGSAPLWSLVVRSITDGHYGPPAKGTRSTGLHLIMPWLGDTAFSRSFDLIQAHDRKLIEDIVFPLLDKYGDEIRADPGKLADMVKVERRRLADERHHAAKLARHQNVVKSHSFSVGEQEIIAFGEPLWPQDTPRYSYKELCHACWYANFWLGLAAAAKWSPTAIGMQGRHLTKYLEPVAPGAVLAIYDVLNAYQQNPDGEKKFPTVPVNFGHD